MQYRMNGWLGWPLTRRTGLKWLLAGGVLFIWYWLHKVLTHIFYLATLPLYVVYPLPSFISFFLFILFVLKVLDLSLKPLEWAAIRILIDSFNVLTRHIGFCYGASRKIHLATSSKLVD